MKIKSYKKVISKVRLWIILDINDNDFHHLAGPRCVQRPATILAPQIPLRGAVTCNCNCIFEQGSVVVFGSYKAWSNLDLDTDTEDPNFCSNTNTPMMFAFVLLILSWVNRTFGSQNTRSLEFFAQYFPVCCASADLWLLVLVCICCCWSWWCWIR